jgi:hypothetical protein
VPLNVDAHDTIVTKWYFDLETVQLNVLATVNVKERLGDVHYFLSLKVE